MAEILSAEHIPLQIRITICLQTDFQGL